MEYAESIIDLVGNTPLVRLSRLTRDLGPLEAQPLRDDRVGDRATAHVAGHR